MKHSHPYIDKEPSRAKHNHSSWEIEGGCPKCDVLGYASYYAKHKAVWILVDYLTLMNDNDIITKNEKNASIVQLFGD
jgi:hypothetical protein